MALAACGVMMSSCGTAAQTASQYDGIYYTRPEKTVSSADLAKNREETDALTELTKTTMLDARDGSEASAQTAASQSTKTLTLNLENANVTTVYVDPFMGYAPYYSYAWAPYRCGWGIYSPAYYAGYDPWFYGGWYGRYWDPWFYDSYWYGGWYGRWYSGWYGGWYDPWYSPWHYDHYWHHHWHHHHHHHHPDPWHDGPAFGHGGAPVHYGSRGTGGGLASSSHSSVSGTGVSGAVRTDRKSVV